MHIPPIMRCKLALAVAAVILLSPASARAQGCVAARGSGVCNVHGDHGFGPSDDSKWEASVGYRYFKSDRHFVGDEEQKQREEEGSQVINTSNFIDANLTYFINERFNTTLTVPFVIHDRSQTYVLNGVRTRYHTTSSGISDVRLALHAWILDPVTPRKWNILAGAGFDAPTGEKASRDIFPVVVGGTNLTAASRTVDQSIQPGDGGWGITLDLYAYYQFTERLTGYINGAYTITPQETEFVPTYRNNPFEQYMSITDAYVGRIGLEYTVLPKYGLTFSLGGRVEGVPVYDLIGGSDWFRRPGYSVGVEPGVMANVHGWKLAAYAPVAVYRNRTQSVPDKQSGGRHGDAAFADFALICSIAHAL